MNQNLFFQHSAIAKHNSSSLCSSEHCVRCSSNDLPGYHHHQVTLRFHCMVGLCDVWRPPTYRRFYNCSRGGPRSSDQPTASKLIADANNKLFYCMLYNITIVSYISFFLTDVTIPHIILENVRTIAFYQTNWTFVRMYCLNLNAFKDVYLHICFVFIPHILAPIPFLYTFIICGCILSTILINEYWSIDWSRIVAEIF